MDEHGSGLGDVNQSLLAGNLTLFTYDLYLPEQFVPFHSNKSAGQVHMKEPTVLLHTDVAGQLWEFSVHSSKSKARKTLGDTLEHKLLITERNTRDLQKKERKSL